ncbi:hypothetical protein ABW21_db0202365 [Orbilia brochopaga]|nr:hypothetical protein ABW21_db0202365 [Drechslerella brochopaga]
MALPKFTIPKEFASQLHYVERIDIRTDDEILASIAKRNPVTSEKNIWSYWHSGITSMPAWNRRNVAAWARICGPSWTIHILDNVYDSPNYALRYLRPGVLPDCFVDQTMEGDYTGQHSADFLRGALLYQYGGVYMDVRNILIRSLDTVCWQQLEDPSTPYRISVPWMYGSVLANHFVAARKGDLFIRTWHDLLVHLWKGRKSHRGIGSDPLVAFCQKIDYTESRKRGWNFDFNVPALEIVEYVCQVVAWLRMCMIDGGGQPGELNWAQYAKDHILWFDALQENWGAETIVGFSGSSLYNALATRLDADKDSEEYKTAYKVVWRLLTNSSTQKISHGKNHRETPALGTLWDMPGNEMKDSEPGTFAELLRYGTVYFEQTRELEYMIVDKPAEIMHKGVFEA